MQTVFLDLHARIAEFFLYAAAREREREREGGRKEGGFGGSAYLSVPNDTQSVEKAVSCLLSLVLSSNENRDTPTPQASKKDKKKKRSLL